jgi:dTDP-glucose 4,6-dehydratase
MKKIKFFVIGSNSFSGASFIDLALTNGFTVFGLSRSTSPNNVFLQYSNNKFKEENFKFYQLDLNKNIKEIMQLIVQEQPQYIINFAAQSMVAESWRYPEQWFMTNAVSTSVLFNKLKDCKFLKKYVHVTTPEVYGSCSGFIDEDAPYNPSTPYAASRAAGDMSLKTFVQNYQFPAVSTRAANVYGPGQKLYRIIPRTVLYIKQGKKLQLHGGGHSERSFIHIDDVSQATLKIALGGMIGETYHISTKSSITIRNLVDMICTRMGVDFNNCVDIVDERPGKDAAYLLNSAKIRDSLDWCDSISLESGIDNVISWVDANIEILEKEIDHYVHAP